MATLDELERRVSKLEKGDDDLDLPKIPLLGKVFATVGNRFSDLVLRTKGDIKIQWGNKYIPLIKDGKLAVENKFIYKSNKIGKKDGIYIVDNDESQTVTLVAGGTQIDLGGTSSNNYVSYTIVQDNTYDEKSLAQQNIGLVSNSISDIKINTGITYSITENKLYTVLNGELYTPTADLPDPITKQVRIQTNSEGALVIAGTGENNGIFFGSSKLYEQNNIIHLNNSTHIHGYSLLLGDGSGVLPSDSTGIALSDARIYNWKSNLNLMADNGVYIRDTLYVGNSPKTMLNENKIQSNLIQSDTFRDQQRTFSLTTTGEYSTLTVDNIIERRPEVCDNIIYPEWYYNINNTIRSFSIIQYKLKVDLYFENKFQVNDIVKVLFVEPYGIQLNVFELYFTVNEIDNNTLTISLNGNIEQGGSYLQIIHAVDAANYTGKQIQLVYRENETFLKSDNKSISLVNTSSIDLAETINTKIGDLSTISGLSGYGIYSNNANFSNIKYTQNYNLPVTDNSANLASTEWIHKLLPKGTIIMFNGITIPEGWHICDGNDGTPNLINRFIKGSDIISVGETGGNSEITLTVENLPEHTHSLNVVNTTAGSGQYYALDPKETNTIQSGSTGEGSPINIEPQYYSLVYIIKMI